MAKPSLDALPVRSAESLARPSARTPPAWTREELSGRIAELSSPDASASLTFAFALVLSAQEKGEPAAWITRPESTFYPPDAWEGGVDLESLVVVRVPDGHAAFRAADRLVRSGAFGLVVLDVGDDAGAPMALLSRLTGLAQKHDAALLVLTEKNAKAPLSGSLVSLRAEASRRRLGDDRFSCELRVRKDKRRPSTWTASEECRGPAGVR